MPALDALLLDRDGTVIAEENYLCDPDKARLIPGAGFALATLARAGTRLFFVSNQSGIGRGYFPREACLAVNARVETLLAAEGAPITGSVFCPHAPDDGCDCRKPALGMWRHLADTYGLDPKSTAMVGDNASDVCFGRAAGLAKTVLVLTGHGRTYAAKLGLPTPDSGFTAIPNPGPDQPDAVAVDLPAAVEYLTKTKAEAGE